MTVTGVGLIQPIKHRASGSATFSPDQIVGLQGWYDSSDASTFSYSSGVDVSQWRDKSGNNRHFAQATVSDQPDRNGTQNGLTTVNFLLDGLLSTFVKARPITMFVVQKWASHADFHYTITGGIIFMTNSVPGRYHVHGGSNWHISSDPSGPYDDMNYHTHTIYLDTVNTSHRRNGVLLRAPENVGTNGIDNLNFGHGVQTVNLYLAEVIVYDSIIVGDNLTNSEAYLKNKWGTP